VTRRSVRLEAADADQFTAGVRAIEEQMDVADDFPADVLAAAEAAAADPRLPDLDRTDVPLVTIDPPGSRDLDQALHIERRGRGYRVFYAIADVAAFVTAGDPVDEEAHARGETLYAPDHRIPLYPAVLSEGAASLLPGQLRPALLWTIDLDQMGEATKVDVLRARVRSRTQYDYPAVHRGITDGTAPEVFTLLGEVGKLRLRREAERGGVSLALPEQEIVVAADGWSLRFRALLPVEQWNAQISLLIGMSCAEIMLYGEVGVVRTLPAPPHGAIARLRRTAQALHLRWPAELDYPAFVRSIDPGTPAGAAMLNACRTLLRGASYVAFDGGVPEHIEHAALASEYAHATAPLRRLVDRYAGEIAVALCADQDLPEWVCARLHDLPKEMDRADQRSHQFDSAVLSLIEAGVLAKRVGDVFSGIITDVDDDTPSKGLVMVHDPAVEAPVTTGGGPLPLGSRVSVRLIQAEVANRSVRFEIAT
jgi:exoribonuclease R